jgi:sialic acid synthase SpsE
MSRVILDFGSGNTHKNNWDYLKRMIDELKAVDTGKHEIIIKHQLFLEAGKNIPLDREIFAVAYSYARSLGYQTTASVFDKGSLNFLLQYDPCFVKIANSRSLDWLIGEVPRKVPVYVSIGGADNEKLYIKPMFHTKGTIHPYDQVVPLLCVSNYPSEITDYEKSFTKELLENCYGISDHTTNFGLWYRYQPQIIEWHYGLADSTGLDAGSFMRTPGMLKEIL